MTGLDFSDKPAPHNVSRGSALKVAEVLLEHRGVMRSYRQIAEQAGVPVDQVGKAISYLSSLGARLERPMASTVIFRRFPEEDRNAIPKRGKVTITEKVVTYLTEHADEEITLDDLAKVSGSTITSLHSTLSELRVHRGWTIDRVSTGIYVATPPSDTDTVEPDTDPKPEELDVQPEPEPASTLGDPVPPLPPVAHPGAAVGVVPGFGDAGFWLTRVGTIPGDQTTSIVRDGRGDLYRLSPLT